MPRLRILTPIHCHRKCPGTFSFAEVAEIRHDAMRTRLTAQPGHQVHRARVQVHSSVSLYAVWGWGGGVGGIEGISKASMVSLCPCLSLQANALLPIEFYQSAWSIQPDRQDAATVMTLGLTRNAIFVCDFREAKHRGGNVECA